MYIFDEIKLLKDMKFRYILPVTLLALVACNDKLEVQEQTVDLNAPEANTSFEVRTPSESPAAWGEQARAADAPAAPAPAQGQASGAINPPHGQPGHRCDIAVGAPLNSAAPAKPAATNAPVKISPDGQVSGDASNVKITRTDNTTNTTTTTVMPSNTSVNSAGGATPAGMNPPHGQPGHRCDIAVGAPLK